MQVLVAILGQRRSDLLVRDRIQDGIGKWRRKVGRRSHGGGHDIYLHGRGWAGRVEVLVKTSDGLSRLEGLARSYEVEHRRCQRTGEAEVSEEGVGGGRKGGREEVRRKIYENGELTVVGRGYGHVV